VVVVIIIYIAMELSVQQDKGLLEQDSLGPPRSWLLPEQDPSLPDLVWTHVVLDPVGGWFGVSADLILQIFMAYSF